MSWLTVLWIGIPCVILTGLFSSKRGQFISKRTKALLWLGLTGGAMFDIGMTLI